MICLRKHKITKVGRKEGLGGGRGLESSHCKSNSFHYNFLSLFFLFSFFHLIIPSFLLSLVYLFFFPLLFFHMPCPLFLPPFSPANFNHLPARFSSYFFPLSTYLPKLYDIELDGQHEVMHTTPTHKYVCMCVCIVFIYVHGCMCMYTMHIYIYVCIYVCAWVYIQR